MGFFDFDRLKPEKECEAYQYKKEGEGTSPMLHIAKLFRYVELCLALVLVPWAFARVPFAVRISGEYFRLLYNVVASPLFVFLLCNVIIVTLLAKSSRLSGQNPASQTAETELYDEYVKKSGDYDTKSQSETDPLVPDPEAIVYHDKQMISEMVTAAPEDNANVFSDSDSDLEHPTAYRRTKSEKFKRESWEEPGQKLRRSETDICRKGSNSDENLPETLTPEDKLSNEEFQRTIDAFIAKQWKFRRQESLPIVLQNQSSVSVIN